MLRDPELIDGLFNSCNLELEALAERKDLSSYVDVSRLLTKSFLLSCASFYEDEVSRIAKVVLDSGQHTAPVRTWLYSAAVNGQFYKWFDFQSATNTNAFLSRFGRDFKDRMRALLDRRSRRRQSERDFLAICQKRNECVHRNYAAYSLDLTLQEVYQRHKSAMSYIRAVDYGARQWLIINSQGGAVPPA